MNFLLNLEYSFTSRPYIGERYVLVSATEGIKTGEIASVQFLLALCL